MDSASFRLSFVVLALAATFGFAAPAPDIHAIAAAVDAHYNHLRTLQCEFTQTYTGAGVERSESGILWLKKPGKMRWEYRSPRAKLFVSDGKEAWFYVPGERQVRRTPVRQLDDLRSPLALLLGKTRLEKELHGLSLATELSPAEPGNVVLSGVPKGMEDRVSRVALEVTPGNWISRILVVEVDGASTEYRFRGQKENGEIASGQFQFNPPPGVEVIDENFGQ